MKSLSTHITESFQIDEAGQEIINLYVYTEMINIMRPGQTKPTGRKPVSIAIVPITSNNKRNLASFVKQDKKGGAESIIIKDLDKAGQELADFAKRFPNLKIDPRDTLQLDNTTLYSIDDNVIQDIKSTIDKVNY